MPSFNKVILAGHLTRDPELKYTASGSPVADFGLAMNRKYKSGEELKEEVCFVDVTVWGSQGENCTKYLTKGKACLVEGYLKLDTWESDQGKRSKIKVVANSVQFLGGKSGQENGQEAQADNDDIPF